MATTKSYLLSLLFLVVGALEAAPEKELEFDVQTAPRFPRSLYEEGVSGVVIMEFSVRNDGSVTDVKVVDSSHVKFAQSAVRAVAQWRAQPWQVKPGLPGVRTFREELYFSHSKEGSNPHRWVRQSVRRASCTKFNKAMADFQAHSPERAWVDMHYFAYTFKVLARSATRLKMTDEQREETGDTLVAAVPQIVAMCKAQPEMRYRDTVPEEIRGML